MSSVIRFLSEPEWRLSSLEDIDKRISNKTVDYVKREHSEIYSRIENTTIPITVLRCDLSKRHHQEYLFTIFHRLNKGGLKLTNQEIRNCIYSEIFNNLLRCLVKTEEVIRIFSIDENKKYRFSNEELILIILAFSQDHSSYRGPLSKYLNGFMAKNRNISDEKAEDMREYFLKIVSYIYQNILQEEPLVRVSKATIEAIFVAVIQNFDQLSDIAPEDARSRYEQLRADPLFSVAALKEGLAATEKVKARLDRAVEIFRV